MRAVYGDLPTACYNALLGPDGALHVAVADMRAMQPLLAAFLAHLPLPGDGGLCVLDCNFLAAHPSAEDVHELALRLRPWTGAWPVVGPGPRPVLQATLAHTAGSVLPCSLAGTDLHSARCCRGGVL
jgi:hypothetical protein